MFEARKILVCIFISCKEQPNKIHIYKIVSIFVNIVTQILISINWVILKSKNSYTKVVYVLQYIF